GVCIGGGGGEKVGIWREDPDSATSARQSGGGGKTGQPSANYDYVHAADFAPILTAFCISFNPQSPSRVRIDSGWNCTASMGSSRWRMPMITPSSVSAVTSRHEGSFSRIA